MTSRPESFRVFLSGANYGFCHLNLAGITKFKYEKKNEKGSGRNSKMTPLCKWPIGYRISTFLSVPLHLTQEKRRCRRDLICIWYFCAILKFDLLPLTWQASFPERVAMIFSDTDTGQMTTAL